MTVGALTFCGLAVAAVDNGSEDGAVLGSPDLSQFEPSVRRVLEDGLAEFETTLASTIEPSEQGHAWGRLGMLYQAHHLLGLAETCYREAARLAPDEFRWRYLAGFLYQDSGRHGESLAAYDAALELDPDYVPAAVRRAQVYRELGRNEEARTALERVLLADPANAIALAEMGRLAMGEKDYAAAAEFLQRSLAIDPGASRLRYTLAMAYRQLGDVERARENLGLRGDTEPAMADPVLAEMGRLSRSAQFYLERGYAASSAGRDREAVRNFRTAVEFNPEDVSARISLGQGLALLGEDEEALAQFDEALRLDPGNTAALYRRGRVMERQGRDGEAIADFRKVLETETDNLQARFRLADALVRSGEFLEAAVEYDRIEVPREQQAMLLHKKGLAVLGATRCDDAVSIFEEALEIRPDSGELYQALARCYSACPSMDETLRKRGLELAQQLFQARRDGAHAETLAMAAAANGHFDQAVHLETQLLAAARKAGDQRSVAWHEALLERFQSDLPAEAPWPSWHPVYRPAVVSAGPEIRESR